MFMNIHSHFAYPSLSCDGVLRWVSDLEHGRRVEMRGAGKFLEALFL